MNPFDIIIIEAQCVLPEETVLKDVAISDGKIVAIEDKINLTAHPHAQIIEAKGKHLLPGIIDTQVHFRDPGLTHKEDLQSGSRSALLGGVTTFLEMPNTHPSTTTKEAIEFKINKAKKTSHTNFGFFIGANGKNLDEIKACQGMDGCPGVKIFLGSSTGDLLLYQEDKLLEIFQSIKSPIALHSENEEMLKERKSIQKEATSVHAHYEWRNVETALSSTERVIGIARKANKKVHVLHITSKEEIEFLQKNKDICTVEVTPQHLTLFAPDIYDQIDTKAQMNPPIRTKEHRDALWSIGIEENVVDVIGSDHAPHTIKEKKRGYPLSPSGMTGVQTILTIMLDHVNQGRLTLEKCVQLLSSRPAQLYNLRNKGALKLGYDADCTLIDLKKSQTLKDEDMASKVGWTPYHNKKIQGVVVGTIINGQAAYLDGVVDENFRGSPIVTI
jgi:dihydroorotase